MAVFTIGNLDTEVILRVENRTTDLARADVWLRDTLVELTSDYELRNEFDQLEIYGNQVNLTVGQQEYPESLFIASTVEYNVATLDYLIWLDPPTNSERWQLEHSHYQKADKFQPVNSVPTEWYRFGNNIGFNPMPDKTYQVQPRMLQSHPINDANLPATVLLIPRDWNEILIWGAAMRGFMELLEFEKAAKIRDMLGNVNPVTGKRSPGLIEGRKKRREQEGHRTESALRVMIRPYSYGVR